MATHVNVTCTLVEWGARQLVHQPNTQRKFRRAACRRSPDRTRSGPESVALTDEPPGGRTAGRCSAEARRTQHPHRRVFRRRRRESVPDASVVRPSGSALEKMADRHHLPLAGSSDRTDGRITRADGVPEAGRGARAVSRRAAGADRLVRQSELTKFPDDAIQPDVACLHQSWRERQDVHDDESVQGLRLLPGRG